MTELNHELIGILLISDMKETMKKAGANTITMDICAAIYREACAEFRKVMREQPRAANVHIYMKGLRYD